MNDLQRKEIFENMTDAQVKDMLEDIKALYANGPKMLAELGRISKLPPDEPEEISSRPHGLRHQTKVLQQMAVHDAARHGDTFSQKLMGSKITANWSTTTSPLMRTWTCHQRGQRQK
jgi:hypothetical protein